MLASCLWDLAGVFARVRTREADQGTCGQCCEPAARLPDSPA